MALGFFSGTAGDWATPYLDSFNRGTNPFNGAWNSFVDAFKLRFESIDPGMEAREAIKGLKQSKGQSVAEYSQVFKDIGDRSGLSDIDLRERFHSGLLPEICQNLIIVNIAQGLAKSLDEAIKRAVSVDTYLHDPTMTNRHSSRSQTSTSHTSDPYSMDIDASRTSNGNTRDSFIARMRGRCYGCGSQSHEKRGCPHKDTTCRYCARRGHLETVCQDKFMGLERNRGKRQKPRQQISATSAIPFTLFPNESAQIATPTPGPVEGSSNLASQIAQLQELLNRANAMAPPTTTSQDF